MEPRRPVSRTLALLARGYAISGGGGCTASTRQHSFKGRDDVAGESSGWKAAINTNWVQDVDTIFRIRFEIEEVNSCATGNIGWKLQRNLNTTSWVDITTTSSVVQNADSTHVTDNAATGDAIDAANDGGAASTRTFEAGYFDEDGSSGNNNLKNEHTELEWVLTIVGTDVSDADFIQFRVILGDDSTLTTYAQTPNIEVNKASTNYTLTADADSFSLTGSAVDLEYGRKVGAGTTSYDVTGSAVGLKYGRVVGADTVAFAVTGTDVTLQADRTLVLDTVAYAVTGFDVGLAKGRTLVPDAGGFVITGTDASFLRTYAAGAEAGSFALTGTDVTLALDRTLAAASGSYAITGADATLTHDAGGSGEDCATTLGAHTVFRAHRRR